MKQSFKGFRIKIIMPVQNPCSVLTVGFLLLTLVLLYHVKLQLRLLVVALQLIYEQEQEAVQDA